jgi:hypothetical protein
VNVLHQKILDDAATLDSLHRRIGLTHQHRYRSEADLKAWHEAAAEFHRRYRELCFPGGEQRWLMFLAGDSAELESALSYLEASPHCFGSGYRKEVIWHRFKQIPLATAQRTRVTAIVFASLEQRLRREFWSMARYLRMHATSAVWAQLEEIAVAGETMRAFKARWLLLARANFPIRRRVYTELVHSAQRPGYRPDWSFAEIRIAPSER